MSCVLTIRPSSSTMSGTFGAAIAGLRDDDVDDERGALERAARRLDARDLDVARQPLLADADGEHRHALRLEAGDRLVERRVRVVGAVGHERRGRRPAGRSARRARDRARRRGACRCPGTSGRRSTAAARPTTRTGRRAALKRLPSAVSSGASARPSWSRDELAARLAVLVGDLHAARVVEQDADEVLLRHRDLEQQHRPQQREEHDQRTAPTRVAEEHDAIAPGERRQPAGTSRARTAPPRRRQPPSATSTGWHRRRTGPARRPAART